MDSFIMGKISVGDNTKQLLRTMEAERIAVILHEDIDEMAAHGLIEANVKAIINAAPTMSGNYPITGPNLLLNSGIPVMEISTKDFVHFQDDMHACVWPSHIELNNRTIPSFRFTYERWMNLSRQANQNFNHQLSKFIDNSLHYAALEKEGVITPISLPDIRTKFSNRDVVVVVRGGGYKEDLLALRHYIETHDPILMGVDGGADALIEHGYRPHIIIGDMDSVSDESLCCGAELLVHAYPDGRAPGLARIQRLGLNALTIRAIGTSEDVAMLMAYERHAQCIVSIGAHTHMNDFLAKGRKGMGSTLLVRMKIGGKLIDAKGISKLLH